MSFSFNLDVLHLFSFWGFHFSVCLVSLFSLPDLLTGDAIESGALLCEIQTDKATVGYEFQDSAVLAKVLVAEKGADIAVGSPIAITVDDMEEYAEFLKADAAGLITAGNTAKKDTQSQSGGAVAPVIDSSKRVSPEHLLMPAASHLAATKHIDVRALQGSGKGGRITKGDILVALSKGVSFPTVAPTHKAAKPVAATPAPVTTAAASVPPPTPIIVGDVATTDAPFDDAKPSAMRKVIARRLTESKATVPHFYASMKCDLDNIMKFRSVLAKEHNIKVSVNDLIIKSAALALRDVPELNASYDVNTGMPRINPSVDVSVAVATPGGLITPIVTGADKRGLDNITNTVKELAGRARDGKLLPHEYQGGTFSLSNLGMFGVSEFSAVINPPQAVIMAVGGGVKTVVPDGKGGVRVATIMTARISCDRRVGDEALSGLFLQSFNNYMTQPHLLLL
jgi:pyruvate dehydrogenase E2 component (dihydrolipoamide acetyltransferase)